MRRYRASAFLSTLSALLCAACAGPPAPVMVRQEIPPGLLTCQPRPIAPDTRDSRVIAVFMVDLDTAGEDCRGKLARVRELTGSTAPP